LVGGCTVIIIAVVVWRVEGAWRWVSMARGAAESSGATEWCDEWRCDESTSLWKSSEGATSRSRVESSSYVRLSCCRVVSSWKNGESASEREGDWLGKRGT
jgi:hypothetical protein